MDLIALLQIFHYGVCFFLIVTVLIQFGRGAETGVFSGASSGSQGIFSSSTKGNFLTKFTTGCAIAFMLSSISLGVLKSRKAHQSVLDGKIDAVNVRLNNDAAAPESTPNAAAPVEANQAPATAPAAPEKK
jgi:preprotein translocase subunit SecG